MMAPERKDRSQGPLKILQLHGRFDCSNMVCRTIRLMNHWAGKSRHDILCAEGPHDAEAVGLIDQAVPVRFLDRPAFGPDAGPGRFVALAQAMRHYDLVLTFGWGAIDGVVTQRLLGLLMGLPPLIHHEDGGDLDVSGPLGLGSDFYRRSSIGSAYALVVPTGTLAHIAIDRWSETAFHIRQIPDGIDVQAYAGHRLISEIPGAVEDERVVIGASVADASAELIDQLLSASARHRGKMQLIFLDAPQEAEILKKRAADIGADVPVIPESLPRARQYLAALDVFVMLAQSDPSARFVSEAMAAGLPLIATRSGDTAEMLSGNNRSFVIPVGNGQALGDALDRMIASAELRAEIGVANHRRALQCFDENVMFDLYGRLYGSAVGREDALL